MKNLNYIDFEKKQTLNSSDIQEEVKSFKERMNRIDFNEYFLSSKLLDINSLNNSNRNILSKSITDKSKQQTIKNTPNKQIEYKFIKKNKITPIDIGNQKLRKSQPIVHKKLPPLDTSKLIKLSLPRIVMKNIQIAPQIPEKTITMKNLEMYNEIRNLHRRLVENDMYK
jgi:hypothetical protein